MSSTQRHANGLFCIASAMAIVAIAMLVFAAPHQRRIAFNTIWLGVSASCFALPLAACAAWSITENTRASGCLLVACIGLAVLPVYLNVGCQDAALGKLGWLTSAQDSALTPLLAGWPAAIWVHATSLVPQFCLLIVFCSGNKRAFEEQALTESARWQVLRHMTIPRLLPLAMLCGVWGVVICAREITVTDLYQIGTVAEQLYLGYSLNQFGAVAGNWTSQQLAQSSHVDWKIHASLFLALTAIGMIATGIYTKQIKSNQIAQLAYHDRSAPPANWRSSGSLCAMGLLVLLVAVPLFNLLYRVGLAIETTPTGPAMTWSLTHGLSALSTTAHEHRHAFYWSALLASGSSLVVMCTAFLGCWLSRQNKYWAIMMACIWALTCALSGPQIGITITQLLSSWESPTMIWLYDQTIFPTVIANVLFIWPIGVCGVWSVIVNIPGVQLDHAKTERISALQRCVEFGLRQNIRKLLGVSILVWGVCFGEFSATQMVLPPGIETVPQVTLGKLHAGVDETTAALAILTTVLIVAIAWLGWIILEKGTTKNQPLNSANDLIRQLH